MSNDIFEYTIEAALPADKEEVLSLYRSMVGYECCAWTEEYPSEKEFEQDINGNAIFVMRDKNGRIAASISLDLDEEVESIPVWSEELAPSRELSRLGVGKDYQNMGLARKMIAYACEECRKRGYKSIHYIVDVSNEKALRSYAHMGIPQVGECIYHGAVHACFEQKL